MAKKINRTRIKPIWAILPLVIVGVIGGIGVYNSDQPASAAILPTALKNVGDSQQVIVVTSASWTATYATLQTWNKKADGTWAMPYTSMQARIGYNGFKRDAERKQNSGTTPAGTYTITRSFGINANPGTKLPYRDVDSNDYWVYDPLDPKTYNIIEPYHSSLAKWRTAEAERLAAYPTQYKYSAIINYNIPKGVYWSEQFQEHRTDTPADVTKGGGIFLHVNGSGATAGCVSLTEANMLKVFKWLDPVKKPKIVMGPSAVITEM